MTIREYMATVALNGRRAEGRVNGVLRGGLVYEGVFYTAAAANIGVLVAPVEQVPDLRYHEEAA